MTKDQEQRFEALQSWVGGALNSAGLLANAPGLEAISGDAGFRCYYRVHGPRQPMLAVDAPPDKEKNHEFFHVARLLRQFGVHTPQIYAVDFDQGFMLIEDFGDALLLGKLQQADEAGIDALYREATDTLLLMHSIPPADAGLEPYDDDKLQQELDLFGEWFVEKLLNHPLDESQRAIVTDVEQQLIHRALQQPQVVVHRDFHSRNLVCLEKNSPGVIDFQDAVTGPITYDLVSLFRDCYIRWPENKVEDWVRGYLQQLKEKQLVDASLEEEFIAWFDWMGLQRHIKVLGIFARLYLRDDKPGYLNDLPLVIDYTLDVAGKYPEFDTFVSWFRETLLPLAKQQEWYS